jgi:hypothetical protein
MANGTGETSRPGDAYLSSVLINIYAVIKTKLTQNKIKEKLMLWSMFLPAGIMVLFFFILFFCIGYTGDEYKYAALFKTSGFVGGLKKLYYIMGFRYSHFFFIYLMLAVVKNSIYYPYTILLVYTSLFTIWYWSLNNIVTFVLNKWLELNVNKVIIRVLSVMLLVQFFFTTSQASEIYTYIASSMSYMMPIIFVCVALTCFISTRNLFREYILLLLCSVFIGGGAENVSMFVIIMCVVYGWIFRNSLTVNKVYKNKFIFFTVLLVACSCIAYTAPGVHLRLKNDDVISGKGVPLNLLSYYVLTFRSLFQNLFSARFCVGVLTFFPWIIVGAMCLKPGEPDNSVVYEKVKKVFSLILFTTILCFFFHVVLTLFLFHNYGYMRIWFPVNFFIAVNLSILFFYFGLKYSSFVYRFSIVFYSVTVLVCAYCIFHVPKIWHYSKEYNDRILFLKRNNEQFKGKVIIVKPLPEGDILSVSDISSDPDYEVNTCFSTFHGLKYRVRVLK